MNTSLQFQQTGDPPEVVSPVDDPCPDEQPDKVRIEILAAPINPSDINFIQGVYGIRPECPSKAGFEGIGKVVHSPENCSLRPGTLVLPLKNCFTWQEQAWCNPEDLLPLPSDLDPIQGSMLSVNPMTAWRLLMDFTDLNPGDWIIQNAGNSAVGVCVIQLAKILGIHTISCVRREDCVDELKSLGAEHVLVEAEETRESIQSMTEGRPPRLALNAVCGESGLLLAKSLGDGGAHVTYGAMSKKPLTLPGGLLIFKDVRYSGFWLTRWRKQTPSTKIISEYQKLASFMEQGSLTIPVDQVFSLSEARKALTRAQEGRRSGKVVFKMA